MDTIVFNADEILEIACQIERNGARFYRRAAELIKHEESRKLLLGLAAMEDEHEATFSSMREGWAKLAETVGPPDGEAASYLRALASGKVFPVDADPAARLKPGVTMEQVLRTAIALERDSIVYYTGVREWVPKELGRERVDVIIREEVRHVGILGDKLSLLQGTF